MITETEAEAARLLAESVPKLRCGSGENERFTLELYRRTVLELLSRTPLDHEAAREFAKLYFIGRRELTVVHSAVHDQDRIREAGGWITSSAGSGRG